MIDKLLSAKHWQLFVATFGVVIIGQMLMMSFVFTTNNPANFVWIFAFMPIMMAIILYIQMGWQYGLIFKLIGKLSEKPSFPYKRIKAFFFIPIIYFVLLFIIMGSFFATAISGDFRPSSGFFGLIALFVPLHFFSIFCMFHTMYWAAKSVKTVEMRKEVTFNDFAGEFFLIWFYPIGVWILQPKVNKLWAGEIKQSSDSLDDIINEDEDEIL
ncbi:MAG: hypothetical protein ABJG68_03140 [Crocinitomicaceae bacterium]